MSEQPATSRPYGIDITLAYQPDPQRLQDFLDDVHARFADLRPEVHHEPARSVDEWRDALAAGRDDTGPEGPPVADGDPLLCPACGQQGWTPGRGCTRCGADDEQLERLEPGPWNDVQ